MEAASRRGPVAGLPEGLSIRPYEPRDNADVWRLHLEGVKQTRAVHPEPLAGYEDDLHALEATYLGAGSNFWVVESPDGLVGMAAVQRVDDSSGRLRRMRVTEAWRRKGVAQALVRAAEAFCRSCGYKTMILDTTEQQTAGQALYERTGFRKTGERMVGPFRVYDYRKGLR